MKSLRDGIVAADTLVAQIFDKAGWRRVYSTADRPVKFAARFTLAVVGLIPRLVEVAGTKGPVGQWLCWLADDHSSRKLAQWGQVFPAQITSTDPVQATPIHDTTTGVDTDLSAMDVTMIDGTTPTVDDFVMVVAGTDLTKQQMIAFKGGGGGSSLVYLKIDSHVSGGLYNAHEVHPVTRADIPGGIATAAAIEVAILSAFVGANTVVMCQKLSYLGVDYYCFQLPMGPCS